MKRDIIEVVEGGSNQEERLSLGWRFVSRDEVKEGGALREEAIKLLNESRVVAPVGSAYRLMDGQMHGKTFENLDYNVVDGPGHDNTEVEMEFALMTKHTAVNLKIFRAKNLNKVDNFGFCNPFVVIWLINRHCRTPHGYARTDYHSLTKREKEEFIIFQQETTVKMKTLNPEWNEEFVIYICPSDEILLLDVYDWNESRKNKCLGRAVVEGVCEAEKSSMGESWENPFEIELSSIVGTIAFHDTTSKLFIGYNVHNYSDDNTIDVPELAPQGHHRAQKEMIEQLTLQNDNDEPSQLYDNNETPQSLDNNVTTQTVFNDEPLQLIGNNEIPHRLENNETSQLRDNNEDPQSLQNNETPLQPDSDEIHESHDNETTQSHSETLESSGLNQSIDGAEATNRNVPYNESNNNDSLDSSYYSWQNIMKRFKDLPFDEPNSQRIQREIAEFYRRSMRSGVPELPSQSAVHDTVANNDNCTPGASGGNESCAPSTPAEQSLQRAVHVAGASNVNPSSQNYKARYEAFINQQKAAAARLTSGERLELKINYDTVFTDAFDKISRIPQDRIHILRAPIVIGEIVRYDLYNIRHEAFNAINEWFSLISKFMFNPNYGLFEYIANNNYTLQINPKSGLRDKNHLEHLKLIGQLTGMAVFHQKLLNAFFIRPFYKMMLGKPITLSDFEAIDYEYFQSLQWIRDNDPYVLGLTFSVDEQAPGQTYMIEKDLIPNGREVSVTEKNKHEYIEKIVEWSINARIKEQMDHFMEGFNDVIPLDAIKIFDEEELELLISGIGEIDVEDLQNNTNYLGYNKYSVVIKYFWKLASSSTVLRSRFLQFVTGTKRVPENGFKDLHGSKRAYGSQGAQEITIREWGTPEDLPRADIGNHRLDLPPYETYSDLEEKLNMAIRGSFVLNQS